MKALTIGFFDGVHRGHREILKHCSTVITFPNHPKEILGGNSPPLLTSHPFKLMLLEELGLQIISLPFTRKIADLSFEDFLAPYAFDHIVLGEGSSFGKNRLGTAETLRVLGLKRGFTVQVIPKLYSQETSISSSKIRALIQEGNLKEASELLGRPHCLLDGEGLLPPPGSYQGWINETPLTLNLPGPLPKGIFSFGSPLNFFKDV